MYYDLLDICDFQGGTQPPKDKWIKESKDGYVRMLQIRDFSQSDDKFIEYVKDSEQLHKCKKDDIMLSRYGYIGQAFMGLEGAYNVALVKVIKKNSVNTKYLYYYFKSNVFKHYLLSNVGARATIPGFNKSELKDAKINIKPLDEQIQIVKILERCEDIINKLNKEIEDFDLLIKARFVEMFGDVQHEGKYKGIRLRELCTTMSGGTPSTKFPKYYDGDIPWISTVSLGPNHIDGSTAKGYITKEAIDKSATKLIPADNILFGTRVGVGKSSLNDVDICTNQDIVAIIGIDENRFRRLFIKHVLDAYQPYYDSIKKGATIVGITGDDLKNTLIPDAPIELQMEYETFVEQVDKSKFRDFIPHN